MKKSLRKRNQKLSNYHFIFSACGIFLFVSEIWKQWYLTAVINRGAYDWWYFPFQLCSIPMYLLLILPRIKRTRIRNAILVFLMCYGMLGGIAVFADTSGLHYPSAILTAHSYLWHILLIFIGTAAAHTYWSSAAKSNPSSDLLRQSAEGSGMISIRFRQDFLGSTLIYGVCCVLASILNLWISPYGHINMFYINPYDPMPQIIFSDLAEHIGNTPAILLYITATICGSMILFLFWSVLFSKRKRYRR